MCVYSGERHDFVKMHVAQFAAGIVFAFVCLPHDGEFDLYLTYSSSEIPVEPEHTCDDTNSK